MPEASPAPATSATADTALRSTLATARRASGASIGPSSIAALRSTAGAADQPAHTSADHAAPSANVASAVSVRVVLRASSGAAVSSTTPVTDARTANPGDAVAYDVTFEPRKPSATTDEL